VVLDKNTGYPLNFSHIPGNVDKATFSQILKEMEAYDYV
jgi:hypothetical protein